MKRCPDDGKQWVSLSMWPSVSIEFTHTACTAEKRGETEESFETLGLQSVMAAAK